MAISSDEYRRRVTELQAQIETLSDEFYGPIVAEYQRRCAVVARGKRPNVSALAKEFGVSQSNLSARINKSEFELERRREAVRLAEAREISNAHYLANCSVLRKYGQEPVSKTES